MVGGLFDPLNIFIIGLGGGFLIPLAYRLRKGWAAAVFLAALGLIALLCGVAMVGLAAGGAPIEMMTAGAPPPIAINLRLDLFGSIGAFSVSLVALIGSVYVIREKYGALILYLLVLVGVLGMIMTRDLFNLFVFLEIVSIATYGLLGLTAGPAALAASFKYMLATILASTFFLVGTMLLYAVTGLLNIDALIAARATIAGPIGYAGLIFLLACLLIELKPFPANGWGLDVYETARGDVAALVSGGVSAGVFFALLKLMPLFEGQLTLIAATGAITFLASNLIGLAQTTTQRMLGYSSTAQMALVVMAAALLYRGEGDPAALLVIGGLFLNHLFAKVGLFWLAGIVGKASLDGWSLRGRQPLAVLAFTVLVVAIAGLPPFPGFFAKWHFLVLLAAGGHYGWIAVVLVGSLLEAAYMFRWLGRTLHAGGTGETALRLDDLLPVVAMAVLLVATGAIMGSRTGIESASVALPLAAGIAVALLGRLPGRLQCLAALILAAVGGLWLAADVTGLNRIYAIVLLAGGLVVSIACLARTDRRPGFYPMLAILLLSLPALPHAATDLEFLFVWELVTLSSYFLVLARPQAAGEALRYLMFSLAAAFFLLVAFAAMQAISGTASLSAFRGVGPQAGFVFVLLSIGFLIKAGAIGVHVWLPGTYAEAEDEVSALLSAVVSKVAIFGLLVGTYIAIRSAASLELAHLLGWIGMLTTLFGAVLAVQQTRLKRLLAWSSLSQLGYIIAAIALMSHLGWVTALYLVANHLMVKGILFLAVAGIILRTGRDDLDSLGGLARRMPFTFAAATVAIVAMSGLPPLAGFGGKWLLLDAMAREGWYGPAILTLLATFVGFLYMARFIQAVFLGAGRLGDETVVEAPPAVLVPQYLFVAGILVVSFFPKLLMEALSAAIDPDFAATTVWEGASLETIYGLWNPLPVMAIAVVVAIILYASFRLAQRRHAAPAGRPREFYRYASSIFAALTPPLAIRFWDGVSSATSAAAGTVRRLYTGNGQIYALYVVYYFLLLYAAGGGLRAALGL